MRDEEVVPPAADVARRGPADRALISDASVLGQTFTLAGLAAVSGEPETQLEPRLRAFVRRELLTHEADPQSPERGQYAFVQALVREVAYNTLAKADRKSRHLAAARYLEALGTDELAGALAGQYLLAARNAAAGQEADALAAQARIALRAAADRAIALGSHDQAGVFLRQAIEVTAEATEQAELLERAGSEASMAGDNEAAERFLREAIDLLATSADRRAMCRASAILGRVMLNAYRTEPARLLLERAAETFADLVEEPEGVALVSQLSRALMFSGQSAASIAMADRILPVAERLDLVPVLADTLITKGSSLVDLGRLREGTGVLEAGRALAESNDLVDTAIRAMINLVAASSDEDPRAALATAKRGIELVQRVGIIGSLLNFRELGGYAAIRAGEWEWAIAEETRGLDVREERARVHSYEILATILVMQGEPAGSYLAETERLLATESGSASQDPPAAPPAGRGPDRRRRPGR